MRLSFYLAACGTVLLFAGCAASEKTPAPAQPPAPISPAKAAPSKPPEPVRPAVKCELKGDFRLVEIEDLKPAGCKVWYTSYGQRREIASSQNGSGHCENVVKKVQGNLETGGYKCAPAKSQ
jgi:hypothetical protein